MRVPSCPFTIAVVSAAVLLGGLALSGCETFVDLDPDDYNPVLVVDSRFEAGVPWTVYVSRTVALSDTAGGFSGAPPVDGAIVTVTDDMGQALVLPPVMNDAARPGGVYGSGYDFVDGQLVARPGPAPEPGRTYTVRVGASGFPPAIATSRTPDVLAEISVGVVRGWNPPDPPPSPGTVQAYSPVDLAIQVVPSGEALEISFVTGFPSPDGDVDPCEVPDQSASVFFTDAPILTESTFLDDIQSGSGRARLRTAVLDLDALVQAADGSISFGVTGENPGPCVVGIDAVALSAEALEARRSAARRRSAGGNPFAEPVPPYSNVEGGAGVFAGASRTRAVVRRAGSAPGH